MTPSSTSREEVIDVIYAALTNPRDSGNRFLHQLLVTAKDGYFSLNLLKGLVVKLADFPLTYLQHCIKHQTDSPRLELSPDNTKVRKARPGGSSSSETDPYGFLVKGSSIQANSGNKRRSSSATNGDLPTGKRHCGTHFTPYRPAFNYEALAREVDDDDNGSVDILPVIFDNGKFYQDASFFNSTFESQVKILPLYDKLEILPIGAQSTEPVFRLKEKTCWNCGSPGHETRQCPEPVNKERVDVNRAAYLADRGTVIKGRYYEQLAYYQEVTGHEPGRLSSTLRDALGLDGDYDEPPYYRAMRMYGYPPGYMGTYADQEYVMKVVCGDQLNGDAPDLKIFGLHDDDDDQDHDKKDRTSKNNEGQQHTTKGPEERVYMVTYPGLYPSQTAANDENPPSSSKQQQGSYQQDQQHTQQHYYNQQHTDGSQHSYHSQSYYSQPQYYNQQYYQGSYDHNGQWNPYYPSAEPHHNNIINQPAYQQYYQGSYDHNGQWTPYYPSAEPHHNNLHNQPTSYTALSATLRIPSPPPPTDLDDNMPPPPPPPPPINLDDNMPPPPPPPPPPINQADNTPSPPPPPPPSSPPGKQ